MIKIKAGEFTDDQYWKLRRGFEKYAENIAGLKTSRDCHPNYYDDDETETAWQSWAACFLYLSPLIEGYALMNSKEN